MGFITVQNVFSALATLDCFSYFDFAPSVDLFYCSMHTYYYSSMHLCPIFSGFVPVAQEDSGLSNQLETISLLVQDGNMECFVVAQRMLRVLFDFFLPSKCDNAVDEVNFDSHSDNNCVVLNLHNSVPSQHHVSCPSTRS